jgi:hypothetical protein
MKKVYTSILSPSIFSFLAFFGMSMYDSCLIFSDNLEEVMRNGMSKKKLMVCALILEINQRIDLTQGMKIFKKSLFLLKLKGEDAVCHENV